jgi:hypothetical protein
LTWRAPLPPGALFRAWERSSRASGAVRQPVEGDGGGGSGLVVRAERLAGERRLAQAAGHDRPGRGVERAQRGCPVVRAGEVAAGGRSGLKTLCGTLPEAHWCSKSVVSSRAARVLRRNDMSGCTRAAPDLYPPQRSWDSASIAIGLARLAPPPRTSPKWALYPRSRPPRDILYRIHAKNAMRLFFGDRNSSGPCPHRAHEGCTDWLERGEGVKRTRLGWVAGYKTGT